MRKILILAGVAGFLGSCSGGTKTGDKGLVAITVAPPNPSIDVGGTLAFTATAHLVDGEAKDVTADPDTQWESSAPGVVSVDDMGTATAMIAGKSLITATRGNVHSPAQQVTVVATPVLTPTPTPQMATHVIISEVMINAVVEPADQYVEVFNPTASNVVMTGFSVAYNNTAGTPFIFPAFTLNAGAYAVLTNTPSHFANNPYPPVTNIFTYTMPDLVNGNGWFILLDGASTKVDEMAYGIGYLSQKPAAWCGTNAPADGGNGKPFSRKPVNSDTDTCSDWISTAAPSPGTPTP